VTAFSPARTNLDTVFSKILISEQRPRPMYYRSRPTHSIIVTNFISPAGPAKGRLRPGRIAIFAFDRGVVERSIYDQGWAVAPPSSIVP